MQLILLSVRHKLLQIASSNKRNYLFEKNITGKINALIFNLIKD